MAFTKIAAAGIGSTETVTLHSLEVLNNATVGGVLTYEDVTNVDSVGLITARAGVVVGSGITLSKDGDIFATGVTTATTFVGALTGNVTGNISGGTVAGSTGTFTGDVDIADKIVHTGDTDTAIRFSGADTITAETGGSERVRIAADGKIGIGTDNPHVTGLSVHGANSRFQLTSPTTGGASGDGVIFGLNGSQDFFINNRETSKHLLFFTENTERLRVTSDGKVGINQDTPRALLSLGGDLAAQKMLLYDNDGGTNEKYGFGIQANELRQFAGGSANLTFGHISSSDGSTFSERLRIDSSGNILTSGDLQLFGSNTSDGSDNKAIMINGGGAISDSRGGYLIVHGNEHSSNPGITRLHAGNVGTAGVEFYTAGSKRMTIDSNGYVTKPAHPAFRAGREAPNLAVNGGSAIVFNTTSGTYGHFNDGGHYSTSTGKFTAPVAGVYSFFTHVIYEGVSDNTQCADVFHMYVNNSSYAYSHKRGYYRADYTGSNGYYTDTGSLFAIKLAANDEVWVRQQLNSFTVHPNPRYTTFSGFLIG